MVNNNQWIGQLDVPIILRSCPVRGFRPRLREKCQSVQTPVYAVKHLVLCACECVHARGDENRELNLKTI